MSVYLRQLDWPKLFKFVRNTKLFNPSLFNFSSLMLHVQNYDENLVNEESKVTHINFNFFPLCSGLTVFACSRITKMRTNLIQP